MFRFLFLMASLFLVLWVGSLWMEDKETINKQVQGASDEIRGKVSQKLSEAAEKVGPGPVEGQGVVEAPAAKSDPEAAGPSDVENDRNVTPLQKETTGWTENRPLPAVSNGTNMGEDIKAAEVLAEIDDLLNGPRR